MYACFGEEAVFTIVGRGGDLFVCQEDICNSFQKRSSYRTSALGRITQGIILLITPLRSLLHTLSKDTCMCLQEE